MTEKERLLCEARIDVFLKRLKTMFYENSVALDAEYCKFEPIVPFDLRTNGRYLKIHVGDTWGKNWERGWFHLRGTVPDEWKNKHVVARINLGGEGLVFSPDGIPLAGLSVHTLWPMNEFFRDRYHINERAKGGESVDLWIEATAGELFGLKLEEDKGTLRPERYGNHAATVGSMELSIFRKDTWQLYIDCYVLNDQMKALPEKSVRRARILGALMNAIDCFKNGDKTSVQTARQFLKLELEKPSSASDLTTRAVGHAHIDTAWLWPVAETIKKLARTFSSQLELIEKYPGYVFGASQPQHYAFMKEHYPGLYKKIQQKVAEGRWEVQGGMWVEADCNIISGESMVRQILYGKNFFKDEFNIDVKNLWLPDVFGYSAALPQILKKSGIDFFITQKLSWNQYNRLPNHTFIWRGIDSSEVITHFPPEDNYNSDLRPSKLMFAQENFDEHAYLDEFLTLFGMGDGGCGATEEILETGLRLHNMEGCPAVEFGPAQEMLDRLAERKHLLPRWVGELYFEMHRGTLTSQAYNKKMNRYMELKLRELEILYSLLPLENYPKSEFDGIWQKVLLNQFHDIIPGSCISPVYENCRQEYETLKNQASGLLSRVGDLLFDKKEDSLVLFNSLSVTFHQPVEIPISCCEYELFDEAGQALPVQIEDETAVALVEIPPLSSVTLQQGNNKLLKNNSGHQGKMILENDLILYEFTSQGTIVRAYDKEVRKEIIPHDEFGNVFSLYEDRPINWDAWDIDIFYENQLLEQARVTAQEWISWGAIRKGIRQEFTIGKSTIIQKVYLAQNSKRLDFVTEVDWRELHKMLRVAFPVAVKADTASFEIQYGYLKRSTHRNTSWDMAKFEVAGHRFADLSDHDYGAALLNNCKYGYKILDHVLDLNILRAPTMPDPQADIGHHEFTYSFLPHCGELIQSDVFSEAAQLNQKPSCFIGYSGKGLKSPYTLNSGNVILEVIKKAEKENAIILRLFEPFGKQAHVDLLINIDNIKVVETDLLESDIQKLKVSVGKVNLHFNPFEIKTIKIMKL